MKRKTVNSILKGVAGVGLTLGGVSALSDANLVFAATSEETPVVNSGLDVAKTPEEGKVDLETYEYAIADANDNVISSMSAAAYDMQNAVKDAQESTDDATATDEEGSKGESELGGEGTPQGQGERIEELEKPQKPSEPDELITLRNELKEIVAGQKTENDGSGSIRTTNYYPKADALVKEMIQYYADVEGFDGSIEFNNPYRSSGLSRGWVSDGIDHDGNEEQNYLETTYKDKDGNTIDIIYYDYVNAAKDKNDKEDWLTDKTTKNNADLIDHIIIVEKTPIFADDEASGLFTFDRDDFRNIIAYKVDDVEIKVGTEEDDEFVVETTVTGNNASGYTVTKKTTKKADQSVVGTTSKTYSVLKKFVDKGRVYYKESKADTPQDNNVGTEEISGGNNTVSSELFAPLRETPAAEIEDEDVPLADVPDVADEDIDTDDDLEEDLDEDVTDLEDEDVPLAVLDLDEPVDIPDADVPLSDNPETGDALTATWIGTAAASVAGLFGASRKKRKG